MPATACWQDGRETVPLLAWFVLSTVLFCFLFGSTEQIEEMITIHHDHWLFTTVVFNTITLYAIITIITVMDTQSASSCLCMCIYAFVCTFVHLRVYVFSAQSLSSQRRSWAELIAWG